MDPYRVDPAPAGGVGLGGMTFPRYRGLLRLHGRDPRVLAQIARGPDDQTVALGLALREGERATLLSIYTRPDHRQRGLAGRVLSAIEDLAHQQGGRQMEVSYMTGTPSVTYLERTLVRHGWSAPAEHSLVIRTDYPHVKDAPWMRERPLPKGMELVPWFRIDSTMRAALSGQDWVPDDLTPLRHQRQGTDGATPEPAVNVGLVKDQRIVGWCLTHRLGERTIRFTSSYVHPDLQRRMMISWLWRYCVLKAVDIGFREATWTVPVTHDAMRRFAAKYMVPYSSQWQAGMRAEKTLENSTQKPTTTTTAWQEQATTRKPADGKPIHG